jgi:hypothetical protein
LYLGRERIANALITIKSILMIVSLKKKKRIWSGARISSTGSIIEVEFDKKIENIEKVLNLFDRQSDIGFNVFNQKII